MVEASQGKGTSNTSTKLETNAEVSLSKKSFKMSPENTVKSFKISSENVGKPFKMSSEVTGEHCFTCERCDKTFSKPSSLARHKYEHSGYNSFVFD